VDTPAYSQLHPFMATFFPEMVATVAGNRVTTVEWEYRPAPAVETWWDHMLKSDFETVELNLNELPWYKHTDSTSEEKDDDGSSMEDDSDEEGQGDDAMDED